MVMEKIKNFIRQSRRVLMVSSKPDKDEYKLSVKITGAGILIVGVIGFVIFLIVKALGGV
ncbi:MAG: protein translocase SEC61 complex subunit gamma [Candidatus Aenigmatarchaeota archaeon]